MSPPSPESDVPNIGRITNLLCLRDQLRNSDLKARFACLFYYIKQQKYCNLDCSNYGGSHKQLFRTATLTLRLEVDHIDSDDFITVLKTMFCNSHNPKDAEKRQKYFKDLWDGASMDVRREVWEAFRASGRNIYRKPVHLDHPHTDPVQRHSNIFDTAQGLAFPSPSPNLDAPARPQSVQPKRDDTFKLSVDDTPVAKPTSACNPSEEDNCASPSSPTVAHTRRKSKARHAKSTADLPSNISAQIPKSPLFPVHEDTKPTENTQPRSEARETPTRARNNVFRNSNTSGTPTILEKLAQNAKAAAHIKQETADESKPTVPVPQHSHCAEEAEVNSANVIIDRKDLKDSFVIREKPPALTYGSRTAPGRLFGASIFLAPKSESAVAQEASNTPWPFANSKEPKNIATKEGTAGKVESAAKEEPVVKDESAVKDEPTVKDDPTVKEEPAAKEEPTVKADAPLPSRNPPANPKTPHGKRGNVAASPAAKGSPRPSIERTRSSAEIRMTVYDILKKPIEQGVIYILHAPSFFENYDLASIPDSEENEAWYKIGISSNVKERIRSLEAKCGITGLNLIHFQKGRMDRLERIEKLCHAELRNFMRHLDCKNQPIPGGKCNTVHKEWFAVELDMAKRTVDRWSKFLEQSPYGEDGCMTSFWGEMASKYGSSEASEGSMDHTPSTDLDAWLEQSISEYEERKQSNCSTFVRGSFL